MEQKTTKPGRSKVELELSGQLLQTAIVQGGMRSSGGNGRQLPRPERSASEEAKGGTGG